MASINILQNKKDIVGLEAIFLNELYLKNSKKYYKLLIRPNFLFDKIDYFDQLFDKHNSVQESIGLNKVEILFYIKTKEGLQQLETAKKGEPLTLKDISITKTKKGVISSKKFEFQELLIPANYVNWTNDLVINYSMSYNGKCLKEVTGKTQGTILINKKPRIEFRENAIIEQNLIAAYLQNDYSKKEKPGYVNILQRNLELVYYNENQNRLDFDVDIKFNYKKWSYVNYQMLGENANNFINFFINGMIDIQNVVTLNEIKTLNIEKYYKLPQIKDVINYKTREINIISALKTKYDWQKNLVLEDNMGHRGIAINPMNENRLNFTKRIKFNDLIIVLSQDLINFDYTQNFEPIIELEFDIKRQYQLQYFRDDLFDINFENFETGSDFINEHQKEIY